MRALSAKVSVVVLGMLALASAAACGDTGSGGRPVVDTGDVIFVPTDALFPTTDSDGSVRDATDDSIQATDDSIDATDDSSADTEPPTDTATEPPTDTAVATDTATAPDTSSCPEGLGCDDHDLCTNNDHCEGGVCVGGGNVCDDHIPCTVDTCDQGICGHSQQADTCNIDSACWSSNQPNPNDACQRCEPSKNPQKWSDIPDCGLGDACDYQTDCYPERVCAMWVTAGTTKCSDPCSGATDCPASQVCTKLPGSAQVGYCQPVDATLLANGAVCTEDYQCQSGMCSDGICAPLCLDEAHCPGNGLTCHPVGDLAIGVVASACNPNPNGSIPLGQVCSPDGGNSFDGAYCASGHCDLTLFPDTNLPCSPICKSETDCAPAQECNLVLYGSKANPDVVPYDPQFTTATRDAVTACYNPGQFGPKLVGAPCTDKSQCGSNKCLGLIPGDPTMYCTSFCELDAECPLGMACKLDVLNLASTWLGTYPTISSQPPVANAYTYVRICKFE